MSGPVAPEGVAPSGYIPVLDGLRAVSIGLVLVGHVLNREGTSPASVDLGFRISATGVAVFFVVSGYLITLLLVREERRDGSIGLGPFYVRRALRILPAFYAYLMAFALLAASGYIPGVPWYDYAASLLYVRNIFGRADETTHLWSLSLEEQFYFLWPAFLLVAAARYRLRALAAAMLAFTAWRAFLLATGRTNWWMLCVYPDQRMDTILVGCGLALLLGVGRFERLSRSVFERGWFAAASAVALVAWLAASPTIPFAGAVHYTTVAILIACLIHWLVRNPGSAVSRALCRPSLLFLGRLSYSLYLWQQLFFIPRTPALDAVRRFPLDLILTFACALASYYAVERPFLALKDRYSRRPSGGVTAARPAPVPVGDGLP